MHGRGIPTGWLLLLRLLALCLADVMVTIFDPSPGASVIITLQNHPFDLGSWVTIIVGVTFVVCVLLFRHGIVGEIEHWLSGKS